MQAELIANGEGQYRLQGVLNFATVPKLATAVATMLQTADSIVLDLSAITSSNSAGLGLLLDTLRQAQQQAKTLQLQNLPADILSLAEVCELSSLLQLNTV